MLDSAADYRGAIDYAKSHNDTTRFEDIRKRISRRLDQIQKQTQPSETADELLSFIVMYDSVLKELGYNVEALTELAEQFRLPEDHSSTDTNEAQQPLQDDNGPVTLTVTNTDNQDKELSSDKKVSASKEYEFQAGTFVTITPSRPVKLKVDYPNLDRQRDRSGRDKKVRIELIEDKPATVTTGDIKITIKVKANNDFREVK